MYPGHLGTIRPLDTIQILYDLAVVQCAQGLYGKILSGFIQPV